MAGIKPSIKDGDRFLMKENGWLQVVEYVNSKSVNVVFDATGYSTTVEAVQLRRGTVRDYLLPSVYGVGFLGVGRHTAYVNNKASWTYTRWINMLERSYSTGWHAEKPAYIPCTVESHWHNFQNFAEWAEQQVGFENTGWQVDKDILKHGNKLYSRDTCCFVPNEINSLLIGCVKSSKRGACCIGVTYCKSSGKFHAQCSRKDSKLSRVGVFSTEAEAFESYKHNKEIYLKDVANKWKSQIDPRAYEALMNYEVLITD